VLVFDNDYQVFASLLSTQVHKTSLLALEFFVKVPHKIYHTHNIVWTKDIVYPFIYNLGVMSPHSAESRDL